MTKLYAFNPHKPVMLENPMTPPPIEGCRACPCCLDMGACRHARTKEAWAAIKNQPVLFRSFAPINLGTEGRPTPITFAEIPEVPPEWCPRWEALG